MNSVQLRRLVLTTIAVCVMIVSSLAPQGANAHAGDESYVYLDITDAALTGQVEFPYGDLRAVLGLTLDGDDAANLAELELALPVLHEFTARHFAIGADSDRWNLTFDGVTTLAQAYGVEGEYAIIPFEADVDGDVPRLLQVRFDPFFDEISTRSALLLISNDWKRGVFDNESEALRQFSADTREHTVDLGANSQWTNFTQSVELGLDHIRTGPDHIFFVLALLLPSVLVLSSTRWVPTRTFGSALWRILKIVTMFTVAHSITFSLAGLGILPLPPSRLVESIIAASIAAAALYNLRLSGANREWMIAFAFGLFHGMGFASLVSDLDVERSTQLVSLAGRNVGIEIGQAAVVLLIFPGLFLVRRTRYYRPFLVVSSILLAVISTGWLIERAFDVNLRISRFVDGFLEFPRVLVAVAAFTAVCAAVRWREQSAGRLIPIEPETSPVEIEQPEHEPQVQ